MQQISKEIILIKNKKKEENEVFELFSGYDIIDGFYISCFKNKKNNKFKLELEYTLEKEKNIQIITKGFENIDNTKITINDTFMTEKNPMLILIITVYQIQKEN